jgi:hypothetical protein
MLDTADCQLSSLALYFLVTAEVFTVGGECGWRGGGVQVRWTLLTVSCPP